MHGSVEYLIKIALVHETQKVQCVEQRAHSAPSLLYRNGWVGVECARTRSLCERKDESGKGVSSRSFMLLLVLLAAGAWEARMVGALLSARECKEERRLDVNACKPVVYGKLPTPECCQRVRVSHVECVCPVITPKLAALIDVNRAKRLIEPSHFKCGSITAL